MYGDTNRLRAKAAELRTVADDLRGRARTMIDDAANVAWTSPAADALRARVTTTADDLGRRASQVDDAADALEQHARRVDEVKQAIEDAAAWVGERWNDAVHVARSVREFVEDVPANAVTGFMKVISTAAAVAEDVVEGVASKVTVFYYEVAGVQVPEQKVIRAREIATAVPSTPVAGSKDWLDLKDTFVSRGWS